MQIDDDDYYGLMRAFSDMETADKRDQHEDRDEWCYRVVWWCARILTKHAMKQREPANTDEVK